MPAAGKEFQPNIVKTNELSLAGGSVDREGGVFDSSQVFRKHARTIQRIPSKTASV